MNERSLLVTIFNWMANAVVFGAIAKLLRQLPRFDSVALIAITGDKDPNTREQIDDAGITHVFSKPCEYSKLTPLLRRICGRVPAD